MLSNASRIFYTVFLLVGCGEQIRSCASEPSRTGRQMSRLYRVQLTKMLTILNEDADPCENFHEHACGFYEDYMADESAAVDGDDDEDGGGTVPPFLDNHQDRMHFFERNRNCFDTPAGKMLSNLYEDCKDRHRFDVIRGQPLPQWQRMLQEIPFLAARASLYARWPLLHYQLLALNDDERVDLGWLQLAAEFAANGVPSLLRVYFAERVIYLAPLDTDCQSVDAIETLLMTLQNGNSNRRGRGRSKQALQVLANELLSFCREFSDPEVLSSVADEPNDIFADVTITSYFQFYFDALNVSATEVKAARKLAIDEALLQRIVALLRSTEPRIIFNFVMWRAYEALRYDDCFLLTDEFEQLLLSEYWHWHVFEDYALSRKVAMATYLYHTTRFQQHRRALLMGEQWDRFLYARLQRSDFNVPRLLSNYAHNHLDPTNLTSVYDADALIPGAFYGNLLALRRQQLRESFFMPHIDAEDYNHPLYFLRHFLYFTILTLQRPLFHYFATLGFELWQKSDLLYSSDGYYTALDCLERQSLLHFEDAPVFQLLDEPTVAEVFRFYRAFNESYRDYQFWLEGESFAFAEDFVLEYFHLNSIRILFYAVAQLYCGRNDALYGPLINRSFMNMPQFELAFNCDAEAPMNPLVKCMVNQCD